VALLERWPLARDLSEAFPPLVTRVAKVASRTHFPKDRVEALLAEAHRSVGLKEASVVRRAEIERLLRRWALVREQMQAVDVALTARVERCPAAKILTTIPEISAVCAATIVSELGTPEDYESPRQVLKLAGMNLIEKSSGMHRGRTRQSKRGRPELRRQLFLLGVRWINRSRGLYRPYYDALLARNGGCKTKAVCAVARKLVPLILRVAQSQEPFDRERWLRNRHQRALIAGDLTR
jgi:transposase